MPAPSEQDVVVEVRQMLFNPQHPLYNELSTAMEASAFARIHRSYTARSQGQPDEYGSRWQPLKPKTIAAKIKQGYPPAIGIRTKAIINSLQPGFSSSEKVVEHGSEIHRFGTRVPHAVHFNRRRPIIPENKSKLVADVVRDALTKIASNTVLVIRNV